MGRARWGGGRARKGGAPGIDGQTSLVILWGSIQGLLQGAAICEAEKFSLVGFSEACSWPVRARLFDVIERIRERRFAADSGATATVSTCLVSVRHIWK